MDKTPPKNTCRRHPRPRDIYSRTFGSSLLLLANRTDGSACVNGRQLPLKPGQIVTGLRELSPDVKEDPHLHRCRGALHYLEKTARIAQATSNQGRVITILNWDTYQVEEDFRASVGADEPQATRKPSANEPQHIGEVKNKRIKNTAIGMFDFETAYQKYPRKEGKAAGIKICVKTIVTQEKFDALCQSIEKYAALVAKNAVSQSTSNILARS